MDMLSEGFRFPFRILARIGALRPWLRPGRLCVCVGVHFLDNWKAKLVLKQNCIQYKADLFDLFILIYTLRHTHTHTRHTRTPTHISQAANGARHWIPFKIKCIKSISLVSIQQKTCASFIWLRFHESHGTPTLASDHFIDENRTEERENRISRGRPTFVAYPRELGKKLLEIESSTLPATNTTTAFTFAFTHPILLRNKNPKYTISRKAISCLYNQVLVIPANHASCTTH